MIGIFSGAIILQVTGGAIDAKSSIQAYGGVFMTALTLDGSMSAPKRKAIFVSIRYLFDLQPSPGTMALFTITSHQASMNVRMTFGALGADIRKGQLQMAIIAF